MTEASTAPTIAAKKGMRPATLTAAAVVLIVSAIFTFATPWLPRGRGFGFGAQGPRNGQASPGNAGGGGGAAVGGGGGGGGGGAGGAGGGGFAAGGGAGGFGAGGAGGGFAAGGAGGGFAAGGGAGGAAARANFAMLARIIPMARTGEAIVGGVFALIAAIGVWQRKKWGMVLALIASVVSLLVAAATLLVPALGRTLRAFTIYLSFVTLPSWQAVVVCVIAVIVAVLVLLPTSMKGYIVAPKERRVM
jgi:hypothetical protein